jgi:serine/threonine-protein kinase
MAADGNVLDSLTATVGNLPRVLLRDAAWDVETGVEPIVRPSSPELPTSPQSGRAGRLHLFGEIARGGMGAVIKGRDVDLGRDLAVKVLLERYRGRSELICRFVEEAQIAGQLQHPGIVPVYELGTLADNRPYFAMKLIRGQTLAELLASRPSPAENLPRFLAIFEAVCQTMAYAHARGVIHRDLKPSNVMVGSFGEVQVMDWGLAKVLPGHASGDDSGLESKPVDDMIRTARSGSGAGESRAGSILGTPAYMAPEQARGELKLIDERSDVFGLGSILCEILTGQPTFAGSSGSDTLRKAAEADLVETFERLDLCKVDAGLSSLARACLAADPADRPRDAREVSSQMTAYLTGVQERLRRAELAWVEARARATEERKRRRAEVGLAAALLVLVMVGSGTWFAFDRAQRSHRLRTAAEVRSALDVAFRLEGEARGREDLINWAEATAAAERAEGILRAGGGDVGLQAIVSETLARIREGHRTAQDKLASQRRDVKLFKDLEEVRLRGSDMNREGFDSAARASAYQAAFAAYGVDVVALSESEATAKLNNPAVREPVAAALDDWPTASNRRLGEKLSKLANRVDPDPARIALRAALFDGQVEKLRNWLRSEGSEILPLATLSRLGTRLRELGATKEAESLLRRGETKHADDFWINFHLANLLCLTNKEDSIRFYTAAKALKPQSPVVHGNLGAVLVNHGRYDEGVAELSLATELMPGYAVAHANLGAVFKSRGRLTEALAAIRRAALLGHNDARVQYFLGVLLQEMGRPGTAEQDNGSLDEAIVAFRHAIRVAPGDMEAHCHLGSVLAARGKYREALAEFERAFELDPDHTVAAYNVGMALQTLGRKDEAISTYKRILERWPDYAQACCNLAGLLVDRGRNVEALPWIEKGHELGSKQPGWNFPSADWLRHTRRMAALEARLAALLRGEDRPQNAAERAEFALLAQRTGLCTASVRLWREAFADDAMIEKDIIPGHRYHAASAAAIAASGMAKDSPRTDVDRALLRGQALDWLQADLAERRNVIDRGTREEKAMQIARLREYQTDFDLASLRDESALDNLSETDRRPCRAFWAKVDAILKIATGGKP